MSAKSFAGKVVIVTGGTSGIGRETAIAFGEQGASVVVSGRRETEGVESVKLIEAAGGKGLFVRTDVSKEEDIVALVAKTVEHFGGLHFAFNNAGVLFDTGPTVASEAEIFDKTYAINVRGVLLSMKHQIPAIIQSGGGAIVNNASVLGIRAMAGMPIYNSSKFAVIGLTKTAALETAKQGVRINAICPAVIETDMTHGMREGNADGVNSLHPIGRVGKPSEVAAGVLYLCSEGAGFTTGIALPVDGGFSI